MLANQGNNWVAIVADQLYHPTQLIAPVLIEFLVTRKPCLVWMEILALLTKNQPTSMEVQICTYNQLSVGKFNLWDTSILILQLVLSFLNGKRLVLSILKYFAHHRVYSLLTQCPAWPNNFKMANQIHF